MHLGNRCIYHTNSRGDVKVSDPELLVWPKGRRLTEITEILIVTLILFFFCFFALRILYSVQYLHVSQDSKRILPIWLHSTAQLSSYWHPPKL